MPERSYRLWGAKVVHSRYCESGKIITAAGVSASIDMALYLASRIVGEAAAKALQLGIEYYPAPPFTDVKNPDAASMDSRAIVQAFESSGAQQKMLNQESLFKPIEGYSI
ncbi:hypothetical protein OAP18_02180 [Gammaproteobacteria bacterium]|nr:hypothetical protein [Gammaproteobacteria bacterium]